MSRFFPWPLFSFALPDPATSAEVARLKDQMPKPADVMPKPETGTAQKGTSQDRFATEDHQHPRLTSAKNVVLDANGYATVEFSRTFDTEPAMAYASLGAIDGPVPDFSGELIKDTSGKFVGIKVYGERKKALPLITGLALLNIGPLVTLLTGYKPWEPAAGAKVSVIAVANSGTT